MPQGHPTPSFAGSVYHPEVDTMVTVLVSAQPPLLFSTTSARSSSSAPSELQDTKHHSPGIDICRAALAHGAT